MAEEMAKKFAAEREGRGEDDGYGYQGGGGQRGRQPQQQNFGSKRSRAGIGAMGVSPERESYDTTWNWDGFMVARCMYVYLSILHVPSGRGGLRGHESLYIRFT